METTTIILIFLAVWIGLVLLYCLFRLCGGRILDVCACDFCRGPCCDCWGTSGQIDQYDNEYPFEQHPPYGQFPSPYPQPSLPPIIIVNGGEKTRKTKSKRSGKTNDDDSSSSSSSSSSSDDDKNDALFLTSSSSRKKKKRNNTNVVTIV